MNDFFLSNNDHLKDPAFVELLNKADVSAVNKFGVLTESSGTVRIRLVGGFHAFLTLLS